MIDETISGSESTVEVAQGQTFESAVKSRRCVVGESPIQGRVSDPL